MRIVYEVPGVSGAYIKDDLTVWYGGCKIYDKAETLEKAKSILASYLESALLTRKHSYEEKLAVIEASLKTQSVYPADWIETYRLSVEEVLEQEREMDEQYAQWHYGAKRPKSD